MPIPHEQETGFTCTGVTPYKACTLERSSTQLHLPLWDAATQELLLSYAMKAKVASRAQQHAHYHPCLQPPVHGFCQHWSPLHVALHMSPHGHCIHMPPMLLCRRAAWWPVSAIKTAGKILTRPGGFCCGGSHVIPGCGCGAAAGCCCCAHGHGLILNSYDAESQWSVSHAVMEVGPAPTYNAPPAGAAAIAHVAKFAHCWLCMEQATCQGSQ